jgi:hypothetical protein
VLGPVKAGEGAKNIIMGLQICNLNQMKLCVAEAVVISDRRHWGSGGFCKNVGE